MLHLPWLCTPFDNTAHGFQELLSRRSAYPRKLMNRFLAKPVREPLSAFTPAELPKAYNCWPNRQQSLCPGVIFVCNEHKQEHCPPVSLSPRRGQNSRRQNQ